MVETNFDGISVSVNLDAQVAHNTNVQGALTIHEFEIKWNPQQAKQTDKPMLTLQWAFPLIDTSYQWHSLCGFNRSFSPDWAQGVSSKLSAGSPLHCFYSDGGQNRYTVALDDAVTPIYRSLGVREETGGLVCRVEIPLDATGVSDHYAVKLWLDRTDCRYEDAIRRVADWWEEKYPSMPALPVAKDPTYSCWYSFHQQVYAVQVEAECARAAEMGMKNVIVDDGWQTVDNARGYAYCGDWEPAAEKIPDMAAHVARVHQLGLKYILWYSVPFVGKYSRAAKRFEGMTISYIDRLGAYTLDPRYPQVREYLIGIYTEALKKWDLDGFKLDFIDSFNRFEDPLDYREGMDYAGLDQAVQRLMVDVMRELRAIKSDILIEFRQRYIGPAMREFGNMFRVGDCPENASTNRVGVVDLRLTSGHTAVHSDMLVWNENERLEAAVRQMQNVLFGTLQLSVRLDRVPPEEAEAIRFWVNFMDENREILQDAPLYAENPQTLYPVVWAQKDGRGIFACYQKDCCVNIPGGMTQACVVNACAGESLLLRLSEGGVWKVRTMDCKGEVCREEVLAAEEGILALEAPESGLISMEKIG